MKHIVILFVLISSVIGRSFGQIVYTKDSAYAQVNCSENIIIVNIGAINNGVANLNLRWRLDTTGKPANFGGITVCDPELCRAENVFQSDFLFTKAVQSSFVIDVISNKKLGEFNFKMFVYNPSDSANTVKVLKFAGKSTCASSIAKAPIQKENRFFIQNGNVVFSDETTLEKVEIFNLVGQVVLSNNSRSNTISLDGIQSGAYVLVAKTTTEDIMQKIVIE